MQRWQLPERHPILSCPAQEGMLGKPELVLSRAAEMAICELVAEPYVRRAVREPFLKRAPRQHRSGPNPCNCSLAHLKAAQTGIPIPVA